MDTKAICNGDWRTLPERCTGTVEVWDQTIGCPECQMNLWFLPASGMAYDERGDQLSALALLPSWTPDWIVRAVKDQDGGAEFDYEPYMALFDKLHPFKFDDCYDPGDEDDGNWPALELYLKAIVEGSLLGE